MPVRKENEVPMYVYLVRHGEAKKEEQDPEQGLTDDGAGEVRKVAAYAEKIGVRVSQIFHSPKRRARETAALSAAR